MSLSRVILFVKDVTAMTRFYSEGFGFRLVEGIPGEWAVLDTQGAQLALHRAFGDNVVGDTPFKPVFTVAEIEPMIDPLASLGARMDPIRHFPDVSGLYCDGWDPEGNRFQLFQK